MFDNLSAPTTQWESAFKSFDTALQQYKNQHGKENVKVIDSLGNTVAKSRLLDGTQFIELTCLTDENKLVIRVVHYSLFDLRILIPNGQ